MTALAPWSYCAPPLPGMEGGVLVERRAGRVPGRPRLVSRPDASPRRRADRGELTCGQCTHCLVCPRRTVEKCALTATRGSATDIAATDAACTRFTAFGEEDGR